MRKRAEILDRLVDAIGEFWPNLPAENVAILAVKILYLLI